MFLVDTNIFLEILLAQDKKEECKQFLAENIGDVNISDFSVHSIGVILFRYNEEHLFERFISDVVSNMSVLSLPPTLLPETIEAKVKFNLDFDDAYQYSLAKSNDLKIVTMDKDFSFLDKTGVLFL